MRQPKSCALFFAKAQRAQSESVAEPERAHPPAHFLSRQLSQSVVIYDGTDDADAEVVVEAREGDGGVERDVAVQA